VPHLELALDVTSETEVSAAIDAVVAQFDRLDIVVNNAGLSVRKDALDLELS
jgi:NAD(P)-dependent dehydrogenase (short-subunit alcohol dehydrogenase family)